jgi:hypothetical protein
MGVRRRPQVDQQPRFKGWNRPHFELTLPQGPFSTDLRSPENAETRLISGFPSYSGGGIRPATFGL